jgi:hypothetical protein
MSTGQQRAAHMLGAAADLLDQGQIVNRLSLAVTAIAIGVLLLPVFPASAGTVPTATVVALVGLVEIFLAARVSLNAALLRRLANDAAEERLDVNAFDSALVALKLVPTGKAGQPIARRFSGTRRLLLWQGVTLAVQVVAAVIGGTAIFWNVV